MKIPKINIKKPEKQTKAEKPKKQENEKQEIAEKSEPVLASIEVSEATVRKVWAGEIAIASAVSLIAVIIAFVG